MTVSLSVWKTVQETDGGRHVIMRLDNRHCCTHSSLIQHLQDAAILSGQQTFVILKINTNY